MRICLIGVTHPSYNPRLIREADTLAASGHDVRVVAPLESASMGARDAELLASREWRLAGHDLTTRSLPGRMRYLIEYRSRRLAVELAAHRPGAWLAKHALVTGHGPLLRLAAREPADWYIAHVQGALPIAVAAARRHRARVGFDCEDLLSLSVDRSAAAARVVEREYLPACDYVSTASQHMAARLRAEYDISAPLVLYNVFPLRLAAGLTSPAARAGSSALRLHWFGQTIGPGRGLEEAVAALGRLGSGVELHLRGTCSSGYDQRLRALARDHGAADRLFFHAPVGHDHLIGTLADFDMGLALEQPTNQNSALTVSNKLFSYLLAGLAVAVTDTAGQCEVFQHFPAAGFSYRAGDVAALAEGIQRWARDRAALAAAQEAAWQAARARWCWDVESNVLLERLEASPAGETVARAAR